MEDMIIRMSTNQRGRQMSDGTFLQVFVTFPSREAADETAHRAVLAKLAACAQVIGPINSTYWWEGRVDKAEEWLCLMKTSIDRMEMLEESILKNHPYEVPEIVAVSLEYCNSAYGQWISRVLERCANQGDRSPLLLSDG